MTAEIWLEAAEAIIASVEYCFLITQGDSGWANARQMQPFPPEENMTIWFGASPRSRKIREIEQNNRVTVAYDNPEEGAYVTLLGHAYIVRDPDVMRAHWRRRWMRYWPDGPAGDDFILIRFEPCRIELMSEARQVAPDPLTQPAVLLRSGITWTPVK